MRYRDVTKTCELIDEWFRDVTKTEKNVDFECVLDDLEIVTVIVGSQKQEFEQNLNVSDIVTSQ